MSNDTEIRHEIVCNMAKAFFACAWADYDERFGNTMYAGCEILDTMPDEMDPAALATAFDLCDTIEKAHGLHLAEVFRRAVAISEEDNAGDHPRTEEYFGHYAAMSAMGHGVGMWDALGDRADEFVGTPSIYIDFSFLELDPKRFPIPDDYDWDA